MSLPTPTGRELEILKVLWDRGEATVREVYEELRTLGIAQNTVQAFLRGMEQKGLVTHRVAGRSFVYRAAVPREGTTKRLVERLLRGAFDGAVDRLVASALSARRPSAEELARLRALLDEYERRRHGGRG